MSDSLGEFEQLILFAILRLGEKAYGVSIRQEIEKRTVHDDFSRVEVKEMARDLAKQARAAVASALDPDQVEKETSPVQ